jgi:hypothetical protein
MVEEGGGGAREEYRGVFGVGRGQECLRVGLQAAVGEGQYADCD